jgi:5-formyltetrahydrofolate cyclo-ligase
VIRKNNQMDFFQWSSKTPLKINKYGIPEPLSKKICYPDILFVPLVGYDSEFNRLGYGGGFYDRYIDKIEKYKKIIKIGLAFSCQKLNKVPTTYYDRKLDFIITEKEILE